MPEPESDDRTPVIKTIVYIANARLPTEKAHGFQICKMCEAFAQARVEVHLLHPFRRQPPQTASQPLSVFRFYGVAVQFRTQMLPNLDLIRMDRFLPGVGAKGISLAQGLVWGWYAARVASALKADIYYTRDIPVAYWLVRRGLPTVFEAHNVPKRIQRWLLSRTVRHSALRQTVSLTSFIRTRVLGLGAPPQSVSIAADAVDLAQYENLPSRAECRARLGLRRDAFIVGYMGRFRTMNQEKGIPQLLDAMKALLSRGVCRPLLLCVGGPLDAVPELTGLPRENAMFVDRVDNGLVPYWLRSFDIAAAPFPFSDHYAYFMSPLKIFEYMAAELPIVASDLPSLREVLRDGHDAYLVPPGDSGALADAIEKLCRDPSLAARLARSARRAVENHTWNKRAARILASLDRKEA